MDVGNLKKGEDRTRDELLRTLNLKKQTLFSFIFQGISVGLSFLLIPVSIKFLNPELYGIWITLLSLINWITIMDVGIGLGLRNKLSEAFATKDYASAREYISTAYILFGSILMIVLLILLVATQLVNWDKIFNTHTLSNSILSKVVSITLIGVIGAFLLGLVNQILHALQKSSLVSFYSIILNLLFICSLYFSENHKGDILFTSYVYVTSSFCSIILISIFVFYKYPYLIPLLRHYNKRKVRSILQVGLEFFVIQIAVVVIFNTDNIIIAQVLGPKEVTSYQLTRQVFSIFSITANLIMTPLWSAYTEAYYKGEKNWIKSQIYKLVLLMIPLTICVVIVGIKFQYIIKLWIDTDVEISTLLIFFMGLYTIISIWNNIFAFFLNGISRTREQLITAVIACIINIPLTVYFAKYFELGSAGIIIGTILSLSIFAFVGPYLVYKLLTDNERISLS